MFATNFRPYAAERLDPDSRRAVRMFKERMETGVIQLDHQSLSRCCDAYAAMPRSGFSSLLDMHSPSYLAHLVVGFGQFKFSGRTALDAISDLSSKNRLGSQCIPQKTEGGDWHPWQTFAYSSIAGISPETQMPSSGVTLRTMAVNSRAIDLCGRGDQDFGHLLIAASFLVPDPKFSFKLDNSDVTLAQVADRALAAHVGRSSICGHFHLTEGLLISSALVPGLRHLAPEAREFLDRQLTTLDYAGTALSDILRRGQYTLDEALDLLQSVGHALELAAFAQIYGFTLSPQQLNVIAYVANTSSVVFLNTMILDEFSTLAHYRRAATLLMEIDNARSEGRCLSTVDPTKYWVNLDTTSRASEPVGVVYVPDLRRILESLFSRT